VNVSSPVTTRSAPPFPINIPIAAAIVAMAAGAIGLAGWIFNVEMLKSIVGTITMKANTAAALVACGASLALTVRGGRRPTRIAQVLAGAAALTGALTLAEHAFDWNFGIDELLFTEAPGAAATTSPGRMGPNAALSFVLAGLALLSLQRGGSAHASRAQGLACALTALATVPIAGYAYGAAPLYDVARYTGIAFPTAIGLLGLGVGILMVRVDAGLMAVFSASGPGGVLARRLLLPAILVPILFGYLRVRGQNAGLYDTGLGTALFAMSLVGVFVALVWRTAAELSSVDKQRRDAEQERTRLLEREQSARAEVEHANRLKDQFLAMLSHELRTPLNAILGYARMLRTGAIPPDKRSKAIEIIERNATAQNQLVDDLLDMSRMTTGRIRLDRQPVPIAAALQEAIESVKPTAEAKGVRLETDVDVFAGLVNGDDGRLRQVFWNLLTNAIKFTPTGGSVNISLATDGDTVRISVRDTGIGIDPDFLPLIFEPFRQADAGVTRTHGGLGLGLAICKQLVELHAGSIAAHSDGVERGASFIVRLPRHVAASNHVETRSPAAVHVRMHQPAFPPVRPLTGLDVLVVDDEHDNLELVRQLLENAGATARVAGNAHEALREFERRAPDLLVADIGMPEMDGCELLQQIRHRTVPGRHIPAVAVTAYARSDDRLRTLSAGFEHHIPKPIDPETFIATLTAAVQHT
jgi:signal transduction histidine kinase